jgi:hypothetical protein
VRDEIWRREKRAKFARRKFEPVNKKANLTVGLWIFDGGADQDRTDDLLTASQALSQLSYSPRIAWNIATWHYDVNKILTRGIEKNYNPKIQTSAGVVKLVDALDSKSSEGNLMSVRFRPSAPLKNSPQAQLLAAFFMTAESRFVRHLLSFLTCV